MTSVSVLFYGRRTRLGRSTTSDSDDLGFLSSSDRSHRRRTNSSNACGTGTRDRSNRRRFHHHPNLRVSPGEFDEFGISSCVRRQACSEDVVPIQHFEGEGPIPNILHGDALDSIRERFSSNERLPRSVLLARERLVQRLRGVSVSSVRHSDETHLRTHFDNYWLNDLENGTNNLVSTSQATGNLYEAISDPQELQREAIAGLHHEVYTKVTNTDGNLKFSVSDECSICLEWFTEGNELISLHCGHRFHSSCLSPWVQTCRKCPYCRSEV